jgi:hypothetical protein
MTRLVIVFEIILSVQVSPRTNLLILYKEKIRINFPFNVRLQNIQPFDRCTKHTSKGTLRESTRKAKPESKRYITIDLKLKNNYIVKRYSLL